MSIAWGISWISSAFNSIDDIFIFLYTRVYIMCVFSRPFFGGYLSPPSYEPAVDVFLVSIPLVLFFILDGVLIWDVVGELGF
jgi:hypothetical protein